MNRAFSVYGECDQCIHDISRRSGGYINLLQRILISRQTEMRDNIEFYAGRTCYLVLAAGLQSEFLDVHIKY
jgi:hypothetical protein